MKDIKKLETALVLYYVHCAVDAALKVTGESPADIAGHIHMTCCQVKEGTDMERRIKTDEWIPETVATWLLKIWDTLAHKEADQACELVSTMLVGASLYDHVSDLEGYDIV